MTVVLSTATAFGQSILHIPGYWLNDFSDDGMVGVGNFVAPEGRRAVTWTAAGGLVQFGLDPGIPGRSNWASVISGDGSAVFGQSFDGPDAGMFRYRGVGTYLRVPIPQFWPKMSWNHASQSGEAACGFLEMTQGPDSLTNAFRWTSETGVQIIGRPGKSSATDISGDGNTVCGYTFDSPFVGAKAWVWTTSSGTRLLEDLPGTGDAGSGALGMSSDGRTVVGYSGRFIDAVLWRDGVIETVIGKLEGWSFAQATSVADDGRTVVGFGDTGAFAWTSAGGIEPLGAFFARMGIHLPDGSNFDNSWRVSANGSTFYGHVDLNSYVVTIPAAPSLTLMSLAMPLAGRRHRR